MKRVETSIIIVNYNGFGVIVDCLTSIFCHLSTPAIEVIVVDNDSQDGSPELIAQKFPQVNLLRQSKNSGFGTANNVGARQARGEYLLLLNSDTLVTNNILPVLVAKLTSEAHVGIVGPRLLNPDGSFQLSICIMNDYGIHIFTYTTYPCYIFSILWSYDEQFHSCCDVYLLWASFSRT